MTRIGSKTLSTRTPNARVSIGTDKVAYTIPDQAEIDAQFEALKKRNASRIRSGSKVVAVQGLGFVGVAVAAAIAGARDEKGGPSYFVIGIDIAEPSSYWKIAKLAKGESPIAAPDPELEDLINEAVNKEGNLAVTASERAYSLADAIVVDVPLDVRDRFALDPNDIELNLKSFENAIRAIGRNMKADALVLVETTVPVGACEKIVFPLLKEERERRGLRGRVFLAHAYERVMPGPGYMASIRRFWRSFAGIDRDSSARAREFLSSFIDTASYPLRELEDTKSSELAKLLENSYRAANIAFIYEWTLLAEDIGINLFDVIESIRVRKGTHDNIRFPGFGVGGYCLTKDQLLAQWGASRLFASDVKLNVTLNALDINARMPLHTFELAKELLSGKIGGKKVAICGVAYLPEVGDTRNSPTAILVERMIKSGADVVVHDPCVKTWPEKPGLRVFQDMKECIKGADCVIFAVPHRAYLELSAQALLKYRLRSGAAIVDAQNIISDDKAARLRGAGYRLAGVGKGHWRKKGYQWAKERA
ncbi:MAG: nucleotide sugar dehydrogenase [Candidatus Omnitrophota bacterium]